MLEVEAVQHVSVGEITEAEALRAGFPSLAELLAHMWRASEDAMDGATLVWRIALRHDGDGDRVPLAREDNLTADVVQQISERLACFDATAPWTAATLSLIERTPRVAASKLAATLGARRRRLRPMS